MICRRGLALFLAAMPALGCRIVEKQPDPPFRITVAVTSDRGEPLEGASVRADGTALGVTGTSGLLTLSREGREGDPVTIDVICPDGYSLRAPRPSVRLARVHGLEVTDLMAQRVAVLCERRWMDLVIVVRSSGGADLPVFVDGKSVATTDAQGVSCISLTRKRDVPSVTVAVETASRPGLRPRSPSRTYDLDGRDAVLVFDESLRCARPLVRGSPLRGRKSPYRLD